MLKLKLQYFGHLMQRTDSFEKTLMLGEIEQTFWHLLLFECLSSQPSVLGCFEPPWAT